MPVLIDPATVKSLFADFGVPGPTDDQVTYYGQKGYTELFQDLLKYVYNELKQCQAAGGAVTKQVVLDYLNKNLS